MRFRRKSADADLSQEADAAVDPDAEGAEGGEAAERPAAPSGTPATGPFDVDDLPADPDDPEGTATPRLDLGSLLLEPAPGLDLRIQVDESTEQVQAVVLTGTDGALELRAFAAPRGGDLWSEVRPKIAADFAQRGGTATERDGRFGPELVCQITVRGEDGRTGTQPSRIVGVNGPRWMLRATLLGRPAVEVDGAQAWEDAIAKVVVRRGAQAMPAGAELPLRLPPRDQLVERD